MALSVGEILEGKVVKIKPYGAFVQFPSGESGMVHISEISTGYVNDINEYLKEGETVKVKVITVSPENVISLSIKALQPRPTQQQRPAQQQRPRPRSQGRPNVYEPRNNFQSTGDNFEDMMNKFKRTSDDKMSDLRDVIDTRRGSKNRKSHQK